MNAYSRETWVLWIIGGMIGGALFASVMIPRAYLNEHVEELPAVKRQIDLRKL